MTGAGMTLKASGARLTTATVHVQVLTIAGRQVTLAVYRQIRRAPLGNGPIWGRINYCVPAECKGRDAPRRMGQRHLHVVWQDGDELRRSDITEPIYGRAWDETYETAQERHDRAMSEWLALYDLPQLFIAV